MITLNGIIEVSKMAKTPETCYLVIPAKAGI
jgi:hypothetical protein